MKNICLLLCAFVLILTSCSKDDGNDAPTPIQDKTVGIWKYYKLFRDNVEVPLSACDKQEVFNVNINGTYTYTYYSGSDNNCQIEEVREGLWSNTGNGVYKFVEGTRTYNRTFTFEENTFFYTIYYQSQNVTDKYVYIKQ